MQTARPLTMSSSNPRVYHPPHEEAMESVPLATEKAAEDVKEETEPSNTEQQRQEQEEAEMEDPWALPEGAPEDDMNQEEEGPPTDTQKALDSLKQSSVRLGSAISTSASGVDQKLGFTKALGDLDQKTHVSDAFKSAAEKVGGWWTSVDSQLGVTETTKEVSQSLKESVVEPITATAGPVVMKSTRNLQTFDEQHGITRSTASTLAKGADMLTKSLVGEQGDASNPESPKDDDDKPDEFVG